MNSSQESLISLSQEMLGPLSQETLNKTLSTIPKEIFDCFMKSNFDADVPCMESMEDHTGDLMELPDPKLIGDIMASIQMPIIESSQRQSSIPATENLPGCFHFKVLTGPEDSSKKCRHTYSPVTHKLYVTRDTPCPFSFSTNQQLDGYVIRAMLYFSSPENRTKVLHRCYHHDKKDQDIGDEYHEHFIRSMSKSAMYYKDLSSKRNSVTVNYENPSIGESYSTYLFKFMCYTSCVGGPNRRLMCIVFTLEKNGMTYGRCKIDLKVCSDPSRDKTSEEQSHRETKSPCLTLNKSSQPLSSIVNNREIPSQFKRKRADNTDEKCRYIKTLDKEEYDYLRSMQRLYHITKCMKKHNWTPTVPDMKRLLKVLSSNSNHEESD